MPSLKENIIQSAIHRITELEMEVKSNASTQDLVESGHQSGQNPQ